MERRKDLVWLIPYIFFSVICLTVFFRADLNCDELWNYNFARNIYNGLMPYRDFNIVQTPLSAYIAAVFLFIFGDGLLSYRIAGYILLTAISCLLYHLCKKITESLFISFTAATVTVSLHLLMYVYSYNYLSILLILIIMELELREKQSTAKNIILGLLFGTLPLVKQNTGLVLMAANIFICIFNCKYFESKLRLQMYRLAFSALPGIIYLICIFFADIWKDFYEYAIYGITTFIHRYTIVDLLKAAPYYGFFVIFFIYALVLIIKKIKINGITRKQLSLSMISIAWLTVAYPLCDAFHLSLTFICFLPAILSFLDKKQYKKYEKYSCIIISVFICISVIFNLIPFGDKYVVSDINKFEYIVMEKQASKAINTVDSYIRKKESEGYKVRIADDSSAVYMIPLDKYEKNWDMLLVGNLGKSNVQDLIETDKQCLYLVFKNESMLSMQNHFELIDYIKENYMLVDEVLNFDVYESK